MSFANAKNCVIIYECFDRQAKLYLQQFIWQQLEVLPFLGTDMFDVSVYKNVTEYLDVNDWLYV